MNNNDYSKNHYLLSIYQGTGTVLGAVHMVVYLILSKN